MNKIISKKFTIAAIALLAVPSVLFAQKTKDVKEKKEKETQQIIITRTGEKEEKIIIEIDGDKIKINGQDAKDMKDVDVHLNNLKGYGNYFIPGPGGNFDIDFENNERTSLFNEDANRAMLGVITEEHEKGAEIKSVTKESGAEKAGLLKGDVLTKIGNKKIETTDDVTEIIRAHKPGDKLDVTFLRNGKEQKATAELGKWKGIRMIATTIPKIEGMGQQWRTLEPTEMPRVFNNNGNFYFSGRPKLGLSIQDTDDGVGVKVLEVEEESNAAKAGLKKDDIIISIDEKEVKGTDDVTKTIKDSKEKTSFIFKVKRDGKTQNIEVKFPKKLKTADL